MFLGLPRFVAYVIVAAQIPKGILDVLMSGTVLTIIAYYKYRKKQKEGSSK